MVATPAYGRTYKTARAAKADFLAGKDFIITDADDKFGRYFGQPFSIRDMDPGERVEIRFGKHFEKCTTVTV
ncbi:MAG TPA: hypothetical protein ENI23_06040 [bacterium]|nr:hypothetical protein [bacterium]